MALPDDLDLRDATTEDLPSIADLRRSVGWPVHEWALRAVLDSRGARCVVVTERDGAIVGVGSGIVYGPLGVVGNMIVAERHRRRGVGSAVLEAVVAWLESSGCERIELYATQAGQPLYRAHGFELIEPGALAAIPRAALDALDADADEAIRSTPGGPEVVDELSAYDAPRFGGDRSAIIARMAADANRPLRIARRGDLVVGYAWIRSEQARIGPFLADEPAVAAALAADAFRAVPATVRSLTTNLPMANTAAVAWLRGLGLELEPWNGRMGRGRDVPRRLETIYGNVVGALG